MACAPCAAAAAALQNDMRGVASQNNSNENCLITMMLLKAWQTTMLCIKQNQKGDLVGLHISQINQILGVIQSALNYPDNYCYYYEQLEYFRDAVLPQIMSNVPECIN